MICGLLTVRAHQPPPDEKGLVGWFLSIFPRKQDASMDDNFFLMDVSTVLQVMVTCKGQAAEMRILSCNIGTNMVSFEPFTLSLADFAAVNWVRRVISDTISGEKERMGDTEVLQLVGQIMSVLKRGGEAQGQLPQGKPVQRKCVVGDADVAYLPQLQMGDKLEEVSLGGQKASNGQDSGVKISLLCSHAFNVASQLPQGVWMNSRYANPRIFMLTGV